MSITLAVLQLSHWRRYISVSLIHSLFADDAESINREKYKEWKERKGSTALMITVTAKESYYCNGSLEVIERSTWNPIQRVSRQSEVDTMRDGREVNTARGSEWRLLVACCCCCCCYCCCWSWWAALRLDGVERILWKATSSGSPRWRDVWEIVLWRTQVPVSHAPAKSRQSCARVGTVLRIGVVNVYVENVTKAREKYVGPASLFCTAVRLEHATPSLSLTLIFDFSNWKLAQWLLMQLETFTPISVFYICCFWLRSQ